MTNKEYLIFRELTWLLDDYVTAVDPDEARLQRIKDLLDLAEDLLTRKENNLDKNRPAHIGPHKI
jgi:hypothetical protein